MASSVAVLLALKSGLNSILVTLIWLLVTSTALAVSFLQVKLVIARVRLPASEPENARVCPPTPRPADTADGVLGELKARLQKAEKELSQRRRDTGMAEVATGVLHNVGNVLNSVNVSATIVGDRLKQSRIANLGKALNMLREHRADLGDFLTKDSKGKMLPGYLETLSEHLTAEQEEMLREMESLCKYLEHIKEIVAMQQSYARLCGVTQTLDVSQLVQDALLMNLGAFERHGIHVEREFQNVPPVTVDKHKVLQVLVNLMRNAKYAMDEQAPAEKILTVGISLKEPGRVLITVRDNGIGIAAENLPLIFEHGFTTKRDGHGFGLHSGLLAAKEMGGSLSAFSEGTGKGAMFFLELPVEPAQAQMKDEQHRNPNVSGVVQSR